MDSRRWPSFKRDIHVATYLLSIITELTLNANQQILNIRPSASHYHYYYSRVFLLSTSI